MSKGIEIKLFGGLSIYRDGKQILESLSNTRKTKFFLSYLIMNIDKEIPHKELFDLLWFGEDYSNPGTALRTILYRYRQLIEQHKVDELANSITSRKGHYKWNTLSDVRIDMYDFEKYAYLGLDDANGGECRDYLKKAIPLYQGKLFPEAEQDHWVVQKATYYRELYTKVVAKYIQYLKEDGEYNEIISVANAAMDIIGKCQLIENEVALADKMGAGKKTDDNRYEIINASITDMSERIDDLQKDMEQGQSDHSAFVCDYETFLEVYRLQRRLLLRSGETMFLSLVTLKGDKTGSVSDVTMNYMDMLGESLKKELRMGDSICRISDDQYAIIYPVDTYEHAQGVMERVKSNFFKRSEVDDHVFLYYIRPLKNCDEL